MESPKVYIFTALQQEAKAIRAVVGRRADVQVCVIGPRAGKLPKLDGLAMRGIIVAGFAGGLEPSLRVGDVVVDGWPAVGADKELLQKLTETPHVHAGLWGKETTFKWLHFGAIHSADRVAATAEEKAGLFRASGALAVDMETAIVRRAATAAGVGGPVVAVRAITDSATQNIDPAMLGLLDDSGRVRGGKLVWLLLRRPWRMGQLLRLRAASRLAGERLGEAVGWLLDSMTRSASGAAK